MDSKCIDSITEFQFSSSQKSRVVPCPVVGEIGGHLIYIVVQGLRQMRTCACLQDIAGPHISHQQGEGKGIKQLARGFIVPFVHLVWTSVTWPSLAVCGKLRNSIYYSILEKKLNGSWQTGSNLCYTHLFSHSECFGSNLFARHWARDYAYQCICPLAFCAMHQRKQLVYVLYKRNEAKNSDKAGGDLRVEAQLLFPFWK